MQKFYDSILRVSLQFFSPQNQTEHFETPAPTEHGPSLYPTSYATLATIWQDKVVNRTSVNFVHKTDITQMHGSPIHTAPWQTQHFPHPSNYPVLQHVVLASSPLNVVLAECVLTRTNCLGKLGGGVVRRNAFPRTICSNPVAVVDHARQ